MIKKTLLIIFAFLTVFSAETLVAQSEASDSECFLVISDLHLTEASGKDRTTLDALLQAAQGKDAVLFLGDNTNNSHTEEHALVLQWAQEIKQESKAEVYIIPGNHDYRSQYRAAAFQAQYREYGWDQSFSRDQTTASYAVITQKGTCLLMLDTNQFGKADSVLPDGGIQESTLHWLKEVLESLPNGTPVFACGHHPILLPNQGERTPGASALSQMLRSYSVSLYLCGHDHGFATVEQDGMRQITVGQPQAYPGWVGIVEKDAGTFSWHTELIYDADSSVYITLRDGAYALASSIARGTLASTPYTDDEDAIQWFAEVFMLYSRGELTPETSDAMLENENCRKWREIITRTVVKDWIINLLENSPENVRQISIPPSEKHSRSLP
ncbi:MAG: metallophosphoesterase [Clostridia bacterium]|nr:metallophosphoesterase [Clostridia bacterium]